MDCSGMTKDLNDPMYRALCSYDGLRESFDDVSEYMDYPPEREEEWIINLLNNLCWGSYEVGEDPDADMVVLTTVDRIMKAENVTVCEVFGPIRKIINDLTLI